VDLHRDTLAIIPNLDHIALWVDGDLDHVLSLVILVVVCRVYQNLIEDLVETWHIRDSLEDNFLSLLIVDPQLLLEHLDTANVSVRSEQNMLKLGLLLIDVFYSIWCFITRAIDAFIFLLRRSSLHCFKMYEC